MTTQPLLNLHTWVSLPNDVRFRIRRDFQIPMSGSTIVSDGVIETDGTTPADISHLTIEKMQKYVDSTIDDFNKLFDLVVTKVMNDLSMSQVPTVQSIPAPIITPKRRGRPVKNNEASK
jgi:hypothetical protein